MWRYGWARSTVGSSRRTWIDTRLLNIANKKKRLDCRNMYPSLFDRVARGYDVVHDPELIEWVHSKMLRPMLPISDRVAEIHYRSKERTTLHSAFMTLPSVLNATNWMTQVLANVDSFRASFKYNGIRVWLIMSSFLPGEHASLDELSCTYSHQLPSGKMSFSALVDRAGKIWVLDSNQILACHRLWEYPTLLEGELCLNRDLQNVLILFDCICIANNSKLLAKSSLDVRVAALKKVADHIQMAHVQIIAKSWWSVQHFFGQDLNELDHQLFTSMEHATRLPIDGLIFSSTSTAAIEVSPTKRQNQIFKYKPKHTVDLWLSDVGTCASGGRRYICAHTNRANELEPSRDATNQSFFKMTSEPRSTASVEYNPEEGVQKFVYSPWQYRYHIHSPQEKSLLSSINQWNDCVDIWLYIDADDKYRHGETNVSELRKWLMQSTDAIEKSSGLLSKSVLIEFGISFAFQTGETVVFNLVPIEVRNDKLYANAPHVVAETCMASMYQSLDAQNASGLLTPKTMKASLSLL